MPEESRGMNPVKLEKQLGLAADFPPTGYDQWKSEAVKSLRGAAFEDILVAPTYEGIPLQPIYTAADISDLPHMAGSQEPGIPPFTRGTCTNGYSARPWEICQEIQESSPSRFNEILRHDLQRGQTAVHLGLERGLPSVSTVEDLETVLADIDLGKYPLHISVGFSAPKPLALLKELFKRKRIPIAAVTGSLAADPLGMLVATGTLPILPDTAFEHMAESVKWAYQKAPNLKTIGVSGLPYHEAGADAVRELAYALASAVEYIDRLLKQGIGINVIAGSMRFTFGIGPFYFMEIAKLRAARMLWTKVAESCGGGVEAQKMTVHARTSRYNQTLYDPYVNMLRTTTEAFAAISGGVDSLHTNPFNEITGGTDEFARRVSRNVQILLAEESGLTRFTDPAGGSYFVETLTHQVAAKAWEMFREIEKAGGMLAALQNGFPQEQVERIHVERETAVLNGGDLMVGVNFSQNDDDQPPVSEEFPDFELVDRNAETAFSVTPLKPRRAAGAFEAKRRQETQRGGQ